MSLIPFFKADYPGAIVVPADSSNVYSPAGHGGVPNQPRAFVMHTPEEKADNVEVTPYWFQTPGANGSTHYYLDNDGDVYQMVPERWGAIANGLLGKPRPSWAVPGSLNFQTLSVEIEGFARNIETTFIVGGPQFNSLVKLIKHRCAHYKIPTDREHIPGHYQLSSDRTDPGLKFPWHALITALNEEDDMKIAPWWIGKPFGAGQWEIDLHTDFGDAPGYLMALSLQPGQGTATFMHGDGRMAGVVNANVGTASFIVNPNAAGKAKFVVQGSISFQYVAASLIK